MSRLARADLILPALIAAFSGAYVVQTWGYPTGAVVFPYAIIALLGLLIAIVVGMRGRPAAKAEAGAEGAAEPVAPSSARPLRGVLMLATSIGYVVVLPFLGFYFTSVAFFAVTFWVLGARRPAIYGAVAVVAPAVLMVLIADVLNLGIPRFVFAELPLGL